MFPRVVILTTPALLGDIVPVLPPCSAGHSGHRDTPVLGQELGQDCGYTEIGKIQPDPGLIPVLFSVTQHVP